MVTPNQQEAPLVKAASLLARSAPGSWQQFLAALEKYSDTQTSSCIQSPIDVLPVAQGRAQNAVRLHALLANCLSMADKIEGR